MHRTAPSSALDTAPDEKSPGGRQRSASFAVQPGFLVRNALSIVLLVLFLVSLAGQIVAGRAVLNEERRAEALSALSWGDYLRNGQFVSATFENWESEFLQMGLYVLLTVSLRQRGSAESRPFPGEEPPQRIAPGPQPAWAAAGGWRRTLYGHSLATAFLLLFSIAFALHWWGSWRHHADDMLMRGETPPGLLEYLGDAQLWFESFQNWQSEFLSVLALVVLSIFLRQKDSSQSKPIDAPHSQTGD